jgi:hypothetical protein
MVHNETVVEIGGCCCLDEDCQHCPDPDDWYFDTAGIATMASGDNCDGGCDLYNGCWKLVHQLDGSLHTYILDPAHYHPCLGPGSGSAWFMLCAYDLDTDSYRWFLAAGFGSNPNSAIYKQQDATWDCDGPNTMTKVFDASTDPLGPFPGCDGFPSTIELRRSPPC